MEPRISIITLCVSDLERSVAFYRDGLGLPLREPASDSIAFFELSGTWLALYPKESFARELELPPGRGGFPGFTLAHNVRTEEEVDALLRQVASAGGEIIKKAGKTDWGGYSGYFSDPDRFLWEAAWNPHFWIE